MFILKETDGQEYYAGGSHQAYNEKQPNTSCSLLGAKKYKTKASDENAMKRINTYASDYVFYVEEYAEYEN